MWIYVTEMTSNTVRQLKMRMNYIFTKSSVCNSYFTYTMFYIIIRNKLCLTLWLDIQFGRFLFCSKRLESSARYVV